MKKVPFINAWLRLIGSLYLDRDNIKEGLKTILKGIDELKNGYSIFVFPEGTRSKDGKMLPFKEGTMKLAEKSGAPIVPVVFTHTSDLFERQMPRLKKAKITMVFGKPIYVKDLAPEDKKFTAKYVQAIMQKTLDEII
jgi:1-acyl-sn-glycerol-3-phosphate acyltransferase